MKFLIDSCISKFAANALRKKNYDVVWIPEEKHDPGDEIIMDRALKEGRILVTADKDFGDLVFVFQQPHPSIIRLVSIKAAEHGKKLLNIIEQYTEELSSNNPLITVQETRVRIKYPLSE